MSGGGFTIGTAHRTAVQQTPVIHILVGDVLWCSGGKGREDNPLGNRLCGTCRVLAREAFEDDVLDPSEVGERWFTDEQLARPTT